MAHEGLPPELPQHLELLVEAAAGIHSSARARWNSSGMASFAGHSASASFVTNRTSRPGGTATLPRRCSRGSSPEVPQPTIGERPALPCTTHARAAGGHRPRGSAIVRDVMRVAVLGVALVALLLVLGAPRAAEASHGVFRFPAPGTWKVLSGYNTASHVGDDPYALDLVRTDGNTAGQPLLAPVSGQIAWTGSNCIGVNDDHGATIHLCHVFAAANLDRRDRVEVGDVLGTVAPDGAAGNNGIAHIHMAVFSEGRTVPYTGIYALEGRQLPATTAWNAYYDQVFSSSQGTATGGGSSSQSISVFAGEDFVVDAGATVTLTAVVDSADVLEYAWSQLAGPDVDFSAGGRSVSFIAPSEPGATLMFQVAVLGAFSRTGSDSIVILVDPDGVAPAAPAPGSEGHFVSGEIPARGFGLVVFSGGSNDDLLTASGCAASEARFWATVGGGFLVYIPGAKVGAVNAAWLAAFPQGVPAGTPLLGRCG